MVKNLINLVREMLNCIRHPELRTYFRLRAKYESDHGKKVPLTTWLFDYPSWRLSLRQGKSPFNDRAIWVVFSARRYLDSLPLKGKKVFEYGMGGSSLYFLDRGCEVVSVDHNNEWYNLLQSKLKGESKWKGYCLPPRTWKPDEQRDEKFISSFPSYEDSCFEDYVRMIEQYPDGFFDIIMVDGRARAGGLLMAQKKLSNQGFLILDNAERKRYADAQNQLLKAGWRGIAFRGAGPYVVFELYDTVIWMPPTKS